MPASYNRRSRGKRSNQKDPVRLWDEPILLDPHTYNKYKHEDYLRSDIHTSWSADTLVGSIGIYINDKNPGRAPIHPTQHFLGNLVQGIIHQASDITQDDRNAFLAAHRENYVCYGYTLHGDTYRSYWAQIRNVYYEENVFFCDLLLRSVTYASKTVAPVGQVRSIGEIIRSYTNKPYTYNLPAAIEATGVSP